MPRLPVLPLVLLAWSAICAGLASGDDWPQYRGPNRDDHSAEQGLVDAFPADGPRLLWTFREAGLGYSGVAVVGSRLYTLGDRGEQAVLIALDIGAPAGGAVQQAWAVALGEKFDFRGNQWSAGPSATPTVDGERVYALSGGGVLACVQARDGKLLWKKHLPTDLGAQVNPIGGGPKNLGWGFTWSPLVDGERLICTPGGPAGTLAALNKLTGATIWRSTELTEQAAYTSVMAAEFGGVRQYVVLTNGGLRGVAAADGKLLWRHDHKLGTEVVNSPLIYGDLIHITVGTAGGNDIVRVTQAGDVFTAEQVYSGNNLTNHHGNVVRVGDFVYGSSNRGFTCQKLATGEVVWSERKLPASSLTCAGGKLFCYAEGDGAVHLAAPSSAGCTILGRFKPPEASANRKPSGRLWTPPVVAGGRLFLRDQELLFCFDVKQ